MKLNDLLEDINEQIDGLLDSSSATVWAGLREMVEEDGMESTLEHIQEVLERPDHFAHLHTWEKVDLYTDRLKSKIEGLLIPYTLIANNKEE